MPIQRHCRICRAPLPEPFLDLGLTPLANAFLRSSQEFGQEASYPLAVCLCPECGLVQLTCVVPAEQLYRQYPYVSSTSEAVRRYAASLAGHVTQDLGLTSADLVVELGSNDGLVLKAFQDRKVQVLGIEPARNIAAVARENGIPTVEEFFSAETASRLSQEKARAAVLLGRHVFAHIDDLHGFFRGVDRLLTPAGVLLIEVPYLGDLLEKLEFDTIYHEHLSYVGLHPLSRLSEEHGFRLVDVERVPLHGGSILLWFQRSSISREPSARLADLWRVEKSLKLQEEETWRGFAGRVGEWKRVFEGFVEELSRAGARWVGYGAAAKANTLLNFCPSVARRLTNILDRNPWKQGSYTPGTHVPVVSADAWQPNGTSHMLILAWNFKNEIIRQMQPFSDQGGRFVVPIPRPEVVSPSCPNGV